MREPKLVWDFTLLNIGIHQNEHPRPGDGSLHCFVESLCCTHTTSLTRLTSIKLKTITPKFKHSFFDTISKLCTPTLSRSPSAPPAPQYDLFSAAGWVYRMARTQEGRARNQIPSPFQKPHSSVLVRGVGRHSAERS